MTGKSKSKPFLKKYRIPIYDVNLWLSVSSDIEQAMASCANITGCDPGKPHRPPRAACCFFNSSGTAILFFHASSVSLVNIAHEVYHAVGYLCSWKMIKLAPGEDEPGAGLYGYLTDLIFRETQQYRQ